jgi:hypothetical protein
MQQHGSTRSLPAELGAVRLDWAAASCSCVLQLVLAVGSSKQKWYSWDAAAGQDKELAS